MTMTYERWELPIKWRGWAYSDRMLRILSQRDLLGMKQ